MKNTIIGGCFALLAAVLAVLIGHYLSKENIDIRYTISESIPANFIGKGGLNNIQQLTIFNRGDKTAEKIRVKLDKRIAQYELTKYSEIDQVEENLSDKSFEILYPELPPEGKIKIVFSSDNFPLSKNDIHINYSKGVGREVFDENSLISPTIVLPVIYLFMFLFFVISESITFRNKWLERDAFRGDEKIFTRKKSPLFMNVDRWVELRKQAIENHVKNCRLSSYDLEESKIVTFLNSEKPDYLKEYEWEILLKESQNTFAERIPSIINCTFFYERDIERFFKIQKPKYFQQNKWDEIIENLQQLYVISLKEKALNIKHAENAIHILENFNNGNKHNVHEKYWDNYSNILKNLYLFYLVDGLFSSLVRLNKDYIEFVKKHDLTVLDESEREFVEQIAYNLQLNTKHSFQFSIETAQKFLKSDKDGWIKDTDEPLAKCSV